MKALLACLCAAAVILAVDPDRVVLSLVVAWIGLAVALAPLVAGAMMRRRREQTRPAVVGEVPPRKARRQSLWVPGMGSISRRSFPYGQSSR